MAEPPMPPNLSLGTQVWRFLVTGGLSAVVDFGLYLLLLELDLAGQIEWSSGQLVALKY